MQPSKSDETEKNHSESGRQQTQPHANRGFGDFAHFCATLNLRTSMVKLAKSWNKFTPL